MADLDDNRSSLDLGLSSERPIATRRATKALFIVSQVQRTYNGLGQLTAELPGARRRGRELSIKTVGSESDQRQESI
jgi:hypothetical protein